MRAAEAFRHVAARSSRHARRRQRCPRPSWHVEEAAHLGQDGVEAAGLVAADRGGVAVHRVAQPDHVAPAPSAPRAAAAAASPPPCPRPCGRSASGAPSRSPGSGSRSGAPARPASMVGPTFMPIGFCDAAQELHMRAVGLARAVADPEEMRRAGIGVAGGGIDRGSAPAHRAAAGFRGWCRNPSRAPAGRSRHAAGAHEAQRLVDARAPGPRSGRRAGCAATKPRFQRCTWCRSA